MKHYYAEECIFDELAASGPQSYKGLVRIAKEQVTTVGDGIFLFTTVNLAVNALTDAGIIEYDNTDHYYDLTDYGYEIISAFSVRQKEYEAYKRTL